MAKKQAIQLFEEKKVRTVWNDEDEKWFYVFSTLRSSFSNNGWYRWLSL